MVLSGLRHHFSVSVASVVRYPNLPVSPCSTVTRLRKAEKAAAIKIKREEVEALRRALEKSGHQKQPILTAPMSGGMFGLTDGPSEPQRVDRGGDPLSESPSTHSSAQSYRKLEPPGAIAERHDLRAEKATLDDDNAKPAQQSHGDARAESPADKVKRQSSGPAAPLRGLSDNQSQGEHRTMSRDSSGDRSQLRPPVADVSPPLSLRRSERGERRRGRPEDGNDLLPSAGGFPRGQGGAAEIDHAGEAAAPGAPGGKAEPAPARGGKNSTRADQAEQGSWGTVGDDGIFPLAHPDEGMASDNPLHR